MVEGTGFTGWVSAAPGEVARAWLTAETPGDGLDREGVAHLMNSLRQLDAILAAG